MRINKSAIRNGENSKNLLAYLYEKGEKKVTIPKMTAVKIEKTCTMQCACATQCPRPSTK